MNKVVIAVLALGLAVAVFGEKSLNSNIAWIINFRIACLELEDKITS